MDADICFREWLDAINEKNWEVAQNRFQDLFICESQPIISKEILLKLMSSHRSMAQLVEIATNQKVV